MEGVIHVHHFGAQVRARDGMFSVYLPDLSGGNDHRTEQFAPVHVRTILLHPNCSMSSDAMLLAEEHGASCLVINKNGEPRVFLAGLRSPNVLEIWKRQLELHGTPEGLAFAREWLCLKVERKLDWMPKLRSYRKDQPAALRAIGECADALMETKFKLLKQPLSDVKAAAGSLRGVEGNGQKSWFRLINYLLPKQYKFEKRSQQPSYDLFNSMLNYGYGILYNWVESELWAANVNPYFGFLHSAERGHKALLYDFIEPYRPWMDRSVFKLLAAKEMSAQQHATTLKDGSCWLTRDGRKLVSNAVYELFNGQKIELANRQWSLRNAIGYEARQFSARLNRIPHPLPLPLRVGG